MTRSPGHKVCGAQLAGMPGGPCALGRELVLAGAWSRRVGAGDASLVSAFGCGRLRGACEIEERSSGNCNFTFGSSGFINSLNTSCLFWAWLALFRVLSAQSRTFTVVQEMM